MKTVVVMLDNHSIRTIRTRENFHVGDLIEDEIWLGHKIIGGKIIKIFK